jgi:PKD repeat protein
MRRDRDFLVAALTSAMIVLTACGGSISPSTPSTTTTTTSQTLQVVNVSAAPQSTTTSDCGAGWLAALNEMAQVSPTAVNDIQVLSWNDYEHTIQIESGVDNCVMIAGSMSGSTLRWTTTGTVAAIDHFAVYASTDGINVTSLGSVPSNVSSLDLSYSSLKAATKYSLFVYAVGRPSFQNKVSTAFSYTTPTPPAPTVTVTVNPTSGTVPLVVSAAMTSTPASGATISSSSIAFGDGTTVNTSSGSHTYSVAGTYTVRATATDSNGQSGSATATVVVNTAPVNQPPVARLTATPSSGTAPLNVNASAAASSDPDGTIASTSINFGDGTVVNAVTASHSYSVASNYTVTATVTDNGGLKSSTSTTVSVTAAPLPNQPPIAKLSVTSSSGTAPVTVTASTAGSTDPDGTIVSTSINFGDGTVLNAASGTHTYSTAGTFTVTATVTDNGGLSSSATAAVTVSSAPPPNQPPLARLAVTPSTGTAPLAVSASTSASTDPDGTIVSRSINFGDGTVVTTATASHTYAAAGTYTVTAAVTDNGGLSSSVTANVTVSAPNQPPVARLTVTPSSGTAPLAVAASAAASTDPDGTIVSVALDFGDGTVVSAASATHTYAAAGAYTAKATVTDNGGLSSSVTVLVTVAAAPPPNQPPSAVLTVTPTSGTTPLAVTASAANSTDPDGTIVSTSVDFGDGTVVSATTGSHTYTTAGNYTVTATVTDNGGLSSFTTATVTVAAAGGGTTHGLTIPSTHPRLWFDVARLVKAKTWYGSHPITVSGDDTRSHMQQALRGLLGSSATDCQAAVNWAVALNPASTSLSSQADWMRWYGEQAIMVYDWCNATFTASQKAQFITMMNTWFDLMISTANSGHSYDVGSMTQPQNNYFWGYLRNALEWGIASYGENTAMSALTGMSWCNGKTATECYIADAIDQRWTNYFTPSAATGGISVGGIAEEGSQYGPYLPNYAVVPFDTSALLGRNIFDSTNYFKENVFAIIYGTTPGPTTWHGTTAYGVFEFDDDQNFVAGNSTAGMWGGVMSSAASRWSGINVGKYAQAWMNNVNPGVQEYIAATATLATPLALSNLPLDYYAPGPGYFYNRKAWDTSSAAVFLELSGVQPYGGIVHAHQDYSSWQMWRGGRWLSRETVGYSDTIVGYNNGAGVDTLTEVAHNVVLVNGKGYAGGAYGFKNGMPAVKRLESNAAYAYADVDATNTYHASSSDNTAVVHVEREFLFVRDLETMVVLDRLQSAAATQTKTFLAHCEVNWTVEDAQHATCNNNGQALRLTTLVPSAPTLRVVTEGGSVGQFRLEVEDSGSVQSYFLTVLQAKAATAANLNAAVVDNGTTLTVTLDGTHSITFNKGMTSSGGSVTFNGTTTLLRTGVQSMTVSDAGPTWN